MKKIMSFSIIIFLAILLIVFSIVILSKEKSKYHTKKTNWNYELTVIYKVNNDNLGFQMRTKENTLLKAIEFYGISQTEYKKDNYKLTTANFYKNFLFEQENNNSIKIIGMFNMNENKKLFQNNASIANFSSTYNNKIKTLPNLNISKNISLYYNPNYYRTKNSKTKNYLENNNILSFT